MDVKTCTKCKQAKPVEEFYRDSRRPGGRLSRCKSCRNLSATAWLREHRLQTILGISIELYEDKLREQDGVCAICGNRQEKRLAVDHCHSTGRVRGLLCSSCNLGIGLLKDSPGVLKKASVYLESYQ